MSYQVQISALRDNALINLRGAKSALAQFESALELEFPKSAQAVCSREGITVLSLAPDHWWVRTSLQNEGQTFDTLAGAVATRSLRRSPQIGAVVWGIGNNSCLLAAILKPHFHKDFDCGCG